jgi:hypothetical protein
MRRKYSIAIAVLMVALASSAGAKSPCPPALTQTAAAVAALRHVPLPFSPPCRVIDGHELRRELDAKLRRDLPIPPEAFLEALARLGMIPSDDASTYPKLLDFYSGQVLGFYEPEHDDMVLVTGAGVDVREDPTVWAHELEHAAQEHRFHLPTRLLAMSANGDRQRAASAVAEGDAMLVMLLVKVPPAGEETALRRAESMETIDASRVPVPPGVPRYFVQDLLFPYTAGLAAVVRAYRAGGWKAVDALLATPPASTAELLHPEFPRPGPPLGDEVLPGVPSGYGEVLTDTLGEWGVAFWLGLSLPEPDAARLARGWDADRLRLVRSRTDPGRWALAWQVRARTDGAREELEHALQRALPARLANLTDANRAPALVWVGHGRTLEVRAAWPAAAAEGEP